MPQQMTNDATTSTAAQTQQLITALLELAASIGSTLVRIQNLPASSGYEPLFKQHDRSSFAARGMPHLIRRHAERLAKERSEEARTVKALRELAKGATGPLSRLRRAKELLNVYASSTLMEAVCETVGVDEFKFADLLQKLCEGDTSVEKPLQAIAARILAKWKPARGPRKATASIAHEYLQSELGEKLKLTRHTYSEANGTFVDPATRATTAEFGLERFDPRPADRRRKRS
jgi:hypothetical protein